MGLWLKFGTCQLKDSGQQGSDSRCDTLRRPRRTFSFNSTVASSQVSSNSRERQCVWACTVRPAELSALSYTLRVRGDVLLARIECCGASGDCGAKKLIVLDFFVGLYVTWHDWSRTSGFDWVVILIACFVFPVPICVHISRSTCSRTGTLSTPVGVTSTSADRRRPTRVKSLEVF